MRTLACYTIIISATAALLVGCGGSQPLVGAPGVTPQSRGITPTRGVTHRLAPGSSYEVLYSFTGFNDGALPQAALIDVNGTLYGTTNQGGGSGCYKNLGCGTVFSMTTSGQETVLHRFAGGSDGALPAGALINVNGTFYGTTRQGGDGSRCGKPGCGTVYSITPSGSEKVLHSFTGPPDGAFPAAALINVNGTLYGTTEEGGNSGGCHLGRLKIGCGTVYSITPSGSENVLFRFVSGSGSGKYPVAPLVDVSGTFYGTTLFTGGGQGTVYSVSASGSETVLRHFREGGNNGYWPHAGLIDVNGKLYSTTPSGGSGCSRYETNGCGVVYSITTTGTEKVLYRFANQGLDGANPYAGLINVHGTLYGTTYEGGAYSCGPLFTGCGTVFSITTSGTEKVLHSFNGGGSDGIFPLASVINVNGTLYGTTQYGGTSGWGSVFALTP